MEPNFYFTYEAPKKRRGRQRAKDGTDPSNGVKQLFELWFDEGAGLTFSEFFREDLSDDMAAPWGYYQTHYIKEDGKFHDVYLGWRNEYFGAGEEGTEFNAAGTKVLSIRKARSTRRTTREASGIR